MATALHNLSEYDMASVPPAEGMRFGIVVSEWNHNITGGNTRNHLYTSITNFFIDNLK